MKLLKYTIIKKRKQYDAYCILLEELVFSGNSNVQDEIDLLQLLIEKWDNENNSFNDLDPIEILKALMLEKKLIPKDLVLILELSKGTVSKILNYHKGLSKESIRKLAVFFSLSQEVLNRPYQLKKKVLV